MRRALMAAVTVAVLALPGVAQAQDVFNSKPYRQKVTVKNMLVHERALQRFADQNGGTRAAGTPGNTATTDYVLKTMRKAGWDAKLQPFEFPFFQETAPATFAQTTPDARDVHRGDRLRADDVLGLGRRHRRGGAGGRDGADGPGRAREHVELGL